MQQGLCNGTASVRLSVRQSVPPIDRCSRRPAGGYIDRQRRPPSRTAHASNCEQCHVVSRRMKLIADWWYFSSRPSRRRRQICRLLRRTVSLFVLFIAASTSVSSLSTNQSFIKHSSHLLQGRSYFEARGGNCLLVIWPVSAFSALMLLVGRAFGL